MRKNRRKSLSANGSSSPRTNLRELAKAPKSGRGRRDSQLTNAREVMKRAARRPKICLRSIACRRMLGFIFGSRYEISKHDMHTVAAQLSTTSKCRVLLFHVAMFLVTPVTVPVVLLAVPLGDAQSYSHGQVIPETQPVFFWFFMPVVLSFLGLTQALWFRRLSALRASTVVFLGMLVSVVTGCATIYGFGLQTGNKLSFVLAMAIAFLVTNTVLSSVCAIFSMKQSSEGGLRAFRAALVIQTAWYAYRGGRGYMEKTGEAWMEAARLDHHAIVMDQISLFRGISSDIRQRILVTMQVKHYKQGEYICREGGEGRHFYILVEGLVSVRVRLPDRSSVEVCRMHSGDYFGEVALLQGNDSYLRSASVIVKSGTACVMSIGRHNFLKTVYPSMSPDAKSALQRAIRRRLNHTARVQLTLATGTDVNNPVAVVGEVEVVIADEKVSSGIELTESPASQARQDAPEKHPVRTLSAGLPMGKTCTHTQSLGNATGNDPPTPSSVTSSLRYNESQNSKYSRKRRSSNFHPGRSTALKMAEEFWMEASDEIKRYKLMRTAVCRRYLRMFLALSSSCGVYAAYFAYMLGFVSVPGDEVFLRPLYILLIGPLRIVGQSIAELLYGRVDRQFARTGWAWHVVMGEGLRVLLFGMTLQPLSIASIVLIDVTRHALLLSLLNRHILVTIYPETVQRIRARVDIALEITFTIAVEAVVALQFIGVMLVVTFGPNNALSLIGSAEALQSGCERFDFSLPLIIVSSTFLFKCVLFFAVRFWLLKYYHIDLTSVLNYIHSSWGGLLATQIISTTCITFAMVLRPAGAGHYMDEFFSELCKTD